MRVKVKLFAAAKDLVGQEEIEVELPTDATVEQLKSLLVATYPSLADLLPHAMFAVNASYVQDATKLQVSDEIACIPPVSGG